MTAPLTKLSVYEDETLLLEKVLPPGSYIIGRDSAADISIVAAGVHSRHARLRLISGSCLIEDLGGGTQIDEAPVTAEQSVFATQKIRLGSATIFLETIPLSGARDEELTASETVRELLPEEIRTERRYELGPLIARGGMGVIVDAHDAPVQRNVAMKLIRAAPRRTDVVRFVREAQITAQLEHPNIVPVHELGVNEAGQPYYTMKYVRGISLKQVLDQLAGGDPSAAAKHPLSSLLLVLQKVCDAIAFAHSRGVIHRDLKPDNIMLGEYGEVLVMDWGLARRLAQQAAEEALEGEESALDAGVDPGAVTQAGAIMGTPHYMPPEQAGGAGAGVDEASDIYALGAILHHVLSLDPPIEGATLDEMLANVRSGRIRPMTNARSSRLRPHLPGGVVPDSLRAVARKAMAADPRERYPSVQAFQADIAAYQNGFATAAEEASAWKHASLFLQRHRTVSLSAAAMLIAGMIFVVNLATARTKAEAAERLAVQQRNTTEERLYVANMLQASRLIVENRPRSARELVERHHVEESGRDLRDWEWHFLNGQLRQDRIRIQVHEGGASALAVSSDYALLATGGDNGEVAVWRSRGLVLERRFSGAHEGGVLCLAWRPDGAVLASGGADGKVRLWQWPSGEKLAQFQLPAGGEVRSIAWQPQGGHAAALAIGGEDERVQLWRPLEHDPQPAPEPLFSLQNGVAELAWSRDGLRLAAAGLGIPNPIHVFDVQKGAASFIGRPAEGEDVLAVALSRDAQFLAAGTKHFAIEIFDLTAKAGEERLPEFMLHRGPVRSVAWSPDDQYLASASEDGTIIVTRPRRRASVPLVLRGHVGAVTGVVWAKVRSSTAADPEQAVIFSTGSDGTLRGWAPWAVEHKGERSKGDNWVAAARWSPDGASIAVVNFRRHVQIVDRFSTKSFPIHAHVLGLFDIAWSPSADRLLGVSRYDGAVELFDARTGRSEGIFAAPGAAYVAWSPSGRYFAAGGAAGAFVWDARSGLRLAAIEQPAGPLTWRGNDEEIVFGAPDGAVFLWPVFSRQNVRQWRAAQPLPPGSISLPHDRPREIFDLRLSPNGRFVAFAAADGAAGLLDANTGKLIRTLSGHTAGVRGVAWREDSRRIATCSLDGSACVFDVESGELILRIDHGDGLNEVHTIDWSPDGQQLITGGYDSLVRVWDASRSSGYETAGRLERSTGSAPRSLAAIEEIARLHAELGSADAARKTVAEAAASVQEQPELARLRAEVERVLEESLSGNAFTGGTTPQPRISPRTHVLLNSIYDDMEAGNAAAAVKRFKELAGRPDHQEALPIARTYFSRASWNVTWFPCRADPRENLAAWREEAAGGEEVTITARALSFPYRRRPPRELMLADALNKRGPQSVPFGMIARAQLPAVSSGWRLLAKGEGCVRIIADGETVLERWIEEGPFDLEHHCEGGAAGVIQLVVEHYARKPVSGFDLQMEPALSGE